MLMCRILCILFLLVMAACEKMPDDFADKQINDVFGGEENDWGVDVIQLADGSYAVAGCTESYGIDRAEDDYSDYSNYWVLKFDAAGQAEWQTHFGKKQKNRVQQIIEDADRNLLIIGHISENTPQEISPNYPDIWLIKLSARGALLAENVLGGSEPEIVRSVCSTSDGGYLVAASTMSYNGDVVRSLSNGYLDNDAWILKLNPNLSLAWQRCLGGSNNDYGIYALENDRGNYSVWSIANSNDGDLDSLPDFYSPSLWFTELDSYGNTLSQQLHDHLDFGFVFACGSNSNNELLGVASINPDGLLWWEYEMHHYMDGREVESKLFKCDQYGNLLWVKTSGLDYRIKIRAIRPLYNGNFILAANSDDDTDDQEMYMLELGAHGTITWQEQLGGDFEDRIYTVIQTQKGSYLATGSTERRSALFEEFNKDLFVYERVK